MLTPQITNTAKIITSPALLESTSLVYAYGLLVPVLLWFGLRYLGVGEWSVVDAVAIWGYGQFVWIPVAVSVGWKCCGGRVWLSPKQLLCVIPIAIVRWVVVGLGALLSGYFLMANVYPILASVRAYLPTSRDLIC